MNMSLLKLLSLLLLFFLGGVNFTRGFKFELGNSTSQWKSGTPILSYHSLKGKPYSVEYDSRSILLNGQRTLLFSGSIHYIRSSPQIWKSVFEKARMQGLNMVTSYHFWNAHELSPGNFTYGDDCSLSLCGKNISRFLSMAQEAGLFVHWRIGPFVAAEWPSGGIPDWVKKVSKVRTSDSKWMELSFNLIEDNLKRIEPFLARNGGPIIMVQIENEYPGHDSKYSDALYRFVETHQIGIPWTMCTDRDPVSALAAGGITNNTIPTFNGCNGGSFGGGDWISQARVARPNTPLIWTENEMWFDEFGYGKRYRPSSEIAATLARWIARGGSSHNFYMWFGGNMFGNWSHPPHLKFGLWHTPSYADDACLHSDSTVNEPLYSRIGELQHLLLHLAPILLHERNDNGPNILTQGKVYCMVYNDSAGPSLLFLSNEGNDLQSVFYHDVCNLKENASSNIVEWRSVSIPAKALVILRIQDSAWNCIYDTSQTIRQCDFSLKDKRSEIQYGANVHQHSSRQSSNLYQRKSGSQKYLFYPRFTKPWIDKQQGGFWIKAEFLSRETGILVHGELLSLNVSGIPLGNIFINGYHVATFSTEIGMCPTRAPPCVKYLSTSCNKSTQDSYFISPEYMEPIMSTTSFRNSTNKTNSLLIFMCQNRTGAVCTLSSSIAPSTEHVHFAAFTSRVFQLETKIPSQVSIF